MQEDRSKPNPNYVPGKAVTYGIWNGRKFRSFHRGNNIVQEFEDGETVIFTMAPEPASKELGIPVIYKRPASK